MEELKIKMTNFAETLSPSREKAQCLNIANFKMENGETIAERLIRDHRSADGALRAAMLMVMGDCAEHHQTERQKLGDFFGTFTFLDGSTL